MARVPDSGVRGAAGGGQKVTRAIRLIGLDIGDRRIGVAFGDSGLAMATPVDVIERASYEQDAARINAFIRDYDAELVIAGLPRNMDGSTGPQAQSTQAYVERIKPLLRAPVQFWDERLTTVEASQRQQTSPTGAGTLSGHSTRRGKKSRRGLDAIAAAVILQDYLYAQANETKDDTR